MTSQKMGTQLIMLLVALALSNVLFAGEPVKNAHKYNGPGYIISNADTIYHVDGDFFSAINARQPQVFNKDLQAGLVRLNKRI